MDSKTYWKQNPITVKISSGAPAVHRHINQQRQPTYRSSEEAVKTGLAKLGERPVVSAKKVMQRDFAGVKPEYDLYNRNTGEMLEVTSGKFKGQRGSLTRLQDQLGIDVQIVGTVTDENLPQQRTADQRVIVQQIADANGNAKLQLKGGHYRPLYKVVSGNALSAQSRQSELTLVEAKGMYGDSLVVRPGLS